ncbi:MAG: hypothetical protein IPL98_08550 [Saprospiraceae bacterium]|nr:hypothetical protein [Saprospiraceae bacterium]
MVIRMDSATQKWYAILSFDQVGIIASLENENPELKYNFKDDILWKEVFIKYVKKHINVNSKKWNYYIRERHRESGFPF